MSTTRRLRAPRIEESSLSACDQWSAQIQPSMTDIVRSPDSINKVRGTHSTHLFTRTGEVPVVMEDLLPRRLNSPVDDLVEAMGSRPGLASPGSLGSAPTRRVGRGDSDPHFGADRDPPRLSGCHASPCPLHGRPSGADGGPSSRPGSRRRVPGGSRPGGW